MSVSTPDRSTSKLPTFLSPSKQTLRVYDGKNWIPKPWSHDFEKYTLERLIHFQRKGAGLPEKVQADLVTINENVKSINSLNVELTELRKKHLHSISKVGVEENQENSSVTSESRYAKRMGASTVHKGTIEDQKRFREITEISKEIIGLHNENLKLINRIYDQIDEYIGSIDEEINICQEKYVKEINSGEQERNAQIIKEQNARRRKEKMMKEKRKAGNGASSQTSSNADQLELAAPKRPPQALPRQSHQMQKLGFPQQKRRKKKKVNKAKKKQVMDTLQDLNFIDEFDDDKSQRYEPTYCLCNSIAYGDMVCCSDRLCIKEWFHYECVGLKAPPDGKWICPDCKERKRREHEEKRKRRGF